MAADVLSDLLKTVRLTGAVFFDVVAKSPWVAEQPDSKLVLPKVLPNADHLISYHVVTQGRCYATMLGEEPIEVEAGEVIVFTRGDPHMLSSSPGMRADPANPDVLDAAVAGPLPVFVNYGAEGPVAAKFVCGFLACDARPFNPLLENLPAVIKASNAKDGGEGWLSQFIRAAVVESANKRAGGEGILAKLSELMFIEVVRRHLESLPPDQAGWLAGLRDSFVGKSLSLMHARPAHDWTIEELAKQVGLSRSVFAERFTDLVGTPPLQYLAKWRMQIALGILDGSNANVASIAARVGYESEAAFSRAFKKMMGVPPSVWRQRGTLRPAAAREASRN
jgi:AraC-like DNA-binding protein